MKSWLKVLCVLCVLCLVLTACTNSSTPSNTTNATTEKTETAKTETTNTNQAKKEKANLTWSTGTTSGSMYPIGVVIADMVNKNYSDRFNITVEVSAGAVENARNIGSKASDIGFISSSTAVDAFRGANLFESPLDFKIILAAYTQPLHVVVLNDSPIKTFNDILGKRLMFGPAGSANFTENTYAVGALGYSAEKDFKPLYIAVADGVEALLNGDCDALMFVGGDPVSGLLDLNSRADIRFISFTDDEIEKLKKNDPNCFTPCVIPAGTYEGIDYDVQTVSVDMTIGVRSDLEDDLVYEFIDAIMNNLDELGKGHNACKQITPETVYPANFADNIHPAAQRYYEEHNLIH